jgi:predicted transposase YbfD/YdcC
MDEQIVSKWEGLQMIVKIEASRIIGDTTVKETRYYISDEIFNDATYFNKLAKGHWGIENHLHWHLDVTFKEDSCRARRGNAPVALRQKFIYFTKIGSTNDK